MHSDSLDQSPYTVPVDVHDLDIIQQPRLNPLAFPAETDGRFSMLIVGTLLLAVYTSVLFIGTTALVGSPLLFADVPWMVLSFHRIAAIVGDRWIFELDTSEIRQLASELRTIQLNALISGIPRNSVLIAFVAAIVGGAFVRYRLHPNRVRRQQQLRPLDSFPHAEFAEKVRQSVQEIAAEAGFAQPPIIEIKASDYQDGQAFGIHKPYNLRMNGRPFGTRVDALDELQRRASTPKFRALVLHELGHIANRDIGKSYFASSLWRVFLTFVIAPMAVLAIVLRTWGAIQVLHADMTDPRQWWSIIIAISGSLVLLAVQILALALIIGAIQRGLLRIREFYADWRAVLWDADDSLRSMLATPDDRIAIRAKSQRHHSRLRALFSAIRVRVDQWWQGYRTHHTLISRAFGWWQRQWTFHTSHAERLQRVNDPSLLFRVSRDLPFLTGVLLAFSMIGMPIFLCYVAFPLLQITESTSWSLTLLVIDWPAPLNRLMYAAIMLSIRFTIPIVCIASILILIAYLVTASLGRQIQREAILDLLPHNKHTWGYMGLWETAFWLTIGVEVGFWIMPTSVFTINNGFSLLLVPVWLAVFAALSWFWLVYVRVLTRQVLGTYTGSAPPRVWRWFVTACSIAALWMLYLPVLLGRAMIVILPYFRSPPPGFFPPQIDPTTFLGLMFGFTLFMLLCIGILLFIALAGGSLVVILFWNRVRLSRCPTCGMRLRDTQAVGRHCPACYRPLAPWLYIAPRRSL